VPSIDAAQVRRAALGILELAIQPEHIHLFVRVQPNISADEVVKECKGLTSRELRLRHKHLLRLPSLWTRSYFASTAGKVSAATIARYVAAPDGALMLKAHRYRLYSGVRIARGQVVWLSYPPSAAS